MGMKFLPGCLGLVPMLRLRTHVIETLFRDTKQSFGKCVFKQRLGTKSGLNHYWGSDVRHSGTSGDCFCPPEVRKTHFFMRASFGVGIRLLSHRLSPAPAKHRRKEPIS